MNRKSIAVFLWFFGVATAYGGAGSARSAEVFVQYDGTNQLTNPLAVSVIGNGYAAAADLTTGAFGASSSVTGNDSQNAYAGLSTPLFITNSGSNVLYLEAGAIHAIFTVTYTLGTNSTQSAQMSAVLSVAAPAFPLTAIAAANHTVARAYDSDGGLIGATDNFQVVFEAFGASVHLVTANLAGADFVLLMPALTLLPGETMDLSFQLTTGVAGPKPRGPHRPRSRCLSV